MNCPCGNSQPYEKCCGPFLSGKSLPDTAEKLMRSRYTAYTRANIEYLRETLSPEGRKDFDPAGTKEWAEGAKWLRLKIESTEKGGPSDTTGIVEFTATYERDGEAVDHHETSRFKKAKDGAWYFVDGDAHSHPAGEGHHHDSTPLVRASPKVGRNDPCPCGSGKKYKKCCEAKE